MKWFALFFVIIFLWQGYLFADYTSEKWLYVYYIWDKAKDFILMLFIILLLRRLYEDRRVIAAWKVVAFFVACRIIWEIIVLTFNLKINDAEAIKWLFYICWGCVAYILFYPTAHKILYKCGIWISGIVMVLRHKVNKKH